MAKRKAQSKAKSSRKSRKKVASKASSSAAWREAWHVTLKALSSAEREVDTQVRGLLARNKLGRKDAQKLLDKFGARLQKERKRTLEEIQSGVKSLQAQVQREQKNFNRAIDDAVEQALATLNIPSRREVATLSRRVQQLSKKIDSFQAKPTRRRRKAATA
jgi:poly(hydroxyalkanoate) granule-associated protein